MLVVAIGLASSARAVPPDVPITNTASATWSVAGNDFVASDNATVITDPAAGNSPPAGLTLSPSTIDENQTGVVGTLVAIDSDPNDTHSYATADPRFVITGDELAVAGGAGFDFETEPQVAVDVLVTDLAGASRPFTVIVAVGDLNEAPTALVLSGSTVVANVPGAAVGTLTATDPDSGDSASYLADDARFEVVAGILKLTDTESLPLGAVVTVTVTVTDGGGLSYSEPFAISAVPPAVGGPADASLALWQWAPGDPGASSTPVAGTACDAGAGFQPLPGPLAFDGTAIAAPGPVALRPATFFKTGEALFLELADANADTDPGQVDTVLVEVSTSEGDAEQLRLTETGPASGRFVGYLQSASGMPVASDCRLHGGTNVTLEVRYVDAGDPADQVQVSALLNPLSRVFLASSGQLIDDAVISIVRAVDGGPASVTGEAPGSSFPATVTSGGQARDDLGRSYDFPAGTYRFPALASGDYQLIVTPPNRFRFPSTVPEAALQLLPGAPFSLGPGAVGASFTVSGPAQRTDIPLDLAPIVPTPAELALETLAGGDPAAEQQPVEVSECFDGGSFAPAPAPLTRAGAPVAVPGVLPLAAASRLNRGDALFIELRDPDQDLDPFAPDQVEIDLALAGGSDRERVRLLETGASTGTFRGYLQTAAGVGVANDCLLSAPAGSELTATYLDPDDASDSDSASLLLDPGFTLFSSSDGSPVDGVNVTLLDAASGLPADGQVFAQDGVTPFPATVTSGAGAIDAAGNTLDFAPGSFRFPVVLPGTYRLAVEPTIRWGFPSARSDAELGALPAGPFVLGPQSRGATFEVRAAGSFEFDLPLDPLTVEVFVSKQASRDVVSIGDFVQYQVLLQNPNAGALAEVTIVDTLPPGFRYQSGSARLGGQRMADPLIADDGRTLSFATGELGADVALELRYVAEVSAGAGLGRARNEAVAVGPGISASNVAFADVVVREDLLESRAFVAGRVVEGECGGRPAGGVAGVRVWLEDGTYVVTDADGSYHLEGLTPGTHVVQLDLATLPATHELVSCGGNAFAGAGHSQFVDLEPGTLWRADFHTRRKPPVEDELRAQLFARATAGRVHHELRIAASSVPVSNRTAVVMPGAGASFEPGSLTVNGRPMADPAGAGSGALSIPLPDLPTDRDVEIGFVTRVDPEVTALTSKAVVMFESPTEGRQKTPVLSTDLRFSWPDSLTDLSRPDFDGAPEEVSASVYEPSRGQLTARSEVGRVAVSAPVQAAGPGFEIPPVDEARAPAFNRAWLTGQDPGNQLVWPAPGYNPRIPAITVAVKHELGVRATVLVNGEIVPPMTFVGTVTDRKRGFGVSEWGNVPIMEGDNALEVRLAPQAADPDGATAGEESVLIRTNVHFSGAPIRAEFVPEASSLIADGVTPPVLAVRFFDRAGYPARPGLTGEFSVAAPHAVLDPSRQLVGADHNKQQGFERYLVRRDGIAWVALEPTSEASEVRLDFSFGELREESIRARLLPGARDWILVGLAEGAVGHNQLSGAAADHDLDENLTSAGRVAFYAKGMVRGDWLLTAAYDTDKATERKLRQEIDPNQYYTLYGDGSSQRYDAESADKLFVKLERQAFQGLYGDYQTGFDDTELGRYARAFTGVKLGYFGQRWEASGFMSDTGFAFVRDEIRGDGTSGTYRLSEQRLVANSERVRIVTRDRFQPDRIVDEVSLTRFLDYTIDYDRGTLIFKQPVFSQDELLNKIFIDVEYEVPTAGGKDLVSGGRLALKLDDDESRVALTVVDDQTGGSSGQLVAADLNWEFRPGTRLKAELARSDTQLAGRGDAYLLEIDHRGADLAGRAYFNEQEAAFGFGQQSGLTSDIRKYGVEGEYRLGERTLIRGQLFRRDDLGSGGDRTVADTTAEYRLGDARLTAGVRSVRETTADGERRDGDQIVAGVGHSLLNDRLLVHGNAEFALGSARNTDYGNRLLLGGDLELLDDVHLIAEQELTFGDSRDTRDTRFGVKARPWHGADLSSTVQRQTTENGERLFATTGLLQQWQLNDSWRVDLGADRVQTLKNAEAADDPGALLASPGLPPASGSINNDFTALFAGLGYRRDRWDASSRIEFHQGDQADKWNLLAGASRQLDNGKVTSASLAALLEDRVDGSRRRRTELRWGLAWRPPGSPWTVLNRLDLAFDELADSVFDSTSRKLVNNTNLNYAWASGAQLSLKLGVKHAAETFDGDDYDSVTLLYGAEYRRNFLPRWDLGVHGGALHSLGADVVRYSAGLSVGHSPARSTWLSLGYNFVGFEDADFAAADYTAEGPYLKLRVKVDQNQLQRFLGFAGLDSAR